MFACVINEYEQYLFCSRDESLVGESIKPRFPVESEYQVLKQKFKENEAFVIEITSTEGEKYKELLQPIKIGNTIWWSYTGVQNKDLLKDVHKLSAFMILASILSLLLLTFTVTRQIVKKLKPLDQLSLATDALVQGNLDYEIIHNSGDEIGKTCIDMRNA